MPQNHQYHWNAIPHFSFIYWKCSVNSENYLGKSIGCMSFNQRTGILRVSLERFLCLLLSLILGAFICCVYVLKEAERTLFECMEIVSSKWTRAKKHYILWCEIPKNGCFCWKFQTIFNIHIFVTTIHSIGNFSCVIFSSFRFLCHAETCRKWCNIYIICLTSAQILHCAVVSWKFAFPKCVFFIKNYFAK